MEELKTKLNQAQIEVLQETITPLKDEYQRELYDAINGWITHKEVHHFTNNLLAVCFASFIELLQRTL